MNVLPLTILFSSLLALFFIIAFAVEWTRGRHGSAERDSLLPFSDDETMAASANHGKTARAMAKNQ